MSKVLYVYNPTNKCIGNKREIIKGQFTHEN